MGSGSVRGTTALYRVISDKMGASGVPTLASLQNGGILNLAEEELEGSVCTVVQILGQDK